MSEIKEKKAKPVLIKQTFEVYRNARYLKKVTVSGTDEQDRVLKAIKRLQPDIKASKSSHFEIKLSSGQLKFITG